MNFFVIPIIQKYLVVLSNKIQNRLNPSNNFASKVKVLFFIKYFLLQQESHFANEHKGVVVSKKYAQTSIASLYFYPCTWRLKKASF